MDWVQTVKTIDYAINSYVSEGNSTAITLQRIGQMPMPVEVLVSLNDGSHQTYYIPLTMMRGGKPAGEMISKKCATTMRVYRKFCTFVYFKSRPNFKRIIIEII